MARRWHWTKRNVAELFPGVAKTCPGCGYIKPLSSFATNRTKKGGVQSRCKLCRTGAMKRDHAREAVAVVQCGPNVTEYRADAVARVRARVFRARKPGRCT